MKALVFGLALISANVLPVGAAHSQEQGAETHDGFYLRLNLVGLGYCSYSATTGGTSVSLYGLAGLGDLGIGGAVTENFILHGDIFGPVISSPKASISIEGFGSAEDIPVAGTVSSMGFGAGATYYVMPYNIYATLIFGTAKLSAKDSSGSRVAETKYGLSTMLTLGKEWWVSDNWGLGIAGSVILQSLPDQDDSTSWTGFAGGILMSASYN